MSHLSEAQILRFLIQLTLLLFVSRTLGELAKRLGQSPVIGELLAGVAAGDGAAFAVFYRRHLPGVRIFFL